MDKSLEQKLQDGDVQITRNGNNFNVVAKIIDRYGKYAGTQSTTRTVVEIHDNIEKLKKAKLDNERITDIKIEKLKDPEQISQSIADLEAIKQESNILFDKRIADELAFLDIK